MPLFVLPIPLWAERLLQKYYTWLLARREGAILSAREWQTDSPSPLIKESGQDCRHGKWGESTEH